jgi:competence protein ComEA
MTLLNRHRARGSLLGLALAWAMALAAPAAAQQVNDTSAQTSVPRSERLDLNRASAAQLEALPGVGPSRAKAIVALRDKLKGFKRSEDLMRVRGIGRKTFRKIAPLVRVDAPRKR